MRIDASRAIGAYAAVTTLVFVWLMLSANPSSKAATFDVQRITIRKPDGTLRMTIASRDRMPGIIATGRETPHPDRPQAGILVYNDEGTENGGVVFFGALKVGKPTNLGALSFDRWRWNQTVAFSSDETGETLQAGPTINDRPDRPVDFPTVERLDRQRAARRCHARCGRQGVAACLPRSHTGQGIAAGTAKYGRPQTLGAQVAAGGRATIDFLGDQGHVTHTITDVNR